MRIGFHVSIAGGFARAAHRARNLGCTTLQIFSQNPRSWGSTPLDAEDVADFGRLREEFDLRPCAVHLPYLPNLATSAEEAWERSLALLIRTLQRTEALGAELLVVHPGSHGGDGVRSGCARAAAALQRALAASGPSVRVLLENTAGQGSQIGSSIAELAQIIDQAGAPPRLGICCDTAHAFAAGYALADVAGLERLLTEVQRSLAPTRLGLLHLNDAGVACGSRRDRHCHIGTGGIGMAGMHRILNHPLLRAVPTIMETPKKTDGDDRRNMRTVRRLTGQPVSLPAGDQPLEGDG